jgi:hypothetical protein
VLLLGMRAPLCTNFDKQNQNQEKPKEKKKKNKKKKKKPKEKIKPETMAGNVT